MKLIDILVQELPKRGGWPACFTALVQGSDGCVYEAGGGMPLFKHERAEDWELAEVTLEQYEVALSAAQPQWNGEGLPPVGCRIEACSGSEWVEATVAYTGRPEAHGDAVAWREVLVFDCKTTRHFWADEFRPIRSEADKKRDEVGLALYHAINWNAEGALVSPSRMEDYKKAFDAIAAGKIPHIRID